MSEGIRRVAVAVRWLGFIAAILTFAYWTFLALIDTGPYLALGLGVGAAGAAAIAGVGAGIAWVIEGFAKR